MYIEAKEESCIHHTFCRAKAIAKMVERGFKYKNSVTLPREKQYGVKHFKSVGARLVSFGDWIAAVSDSDAVIYKGASVSGGALSMLWYNKIGVIFASSMSSYKRIEPTNMQLTCNWTDSSCCTLRLVDGEKSSEINIEITVV